MKLREARAYFVREYLRNALVISGGCVKKAAHLAGEKPANMYKLLERYGLRALHSQHGNLEWRELH